MLLALIILAMSCVACGPALPGDGDGDTTGEVGSDGDGEPGPCEPFVEGDLGEPSFLWGPCDSGQCASWCGVQLECMAEGGVTVCAAPGIAPSCDVLPASPHTSTSATQDGDACVLSCNADNQCDQPLACSGDDGFCGWSH